MLTQNGNGYTENDGYFVTEYDENWNVTSITKDADENDGKVATPVEVDGTVVAYTYTIGDVEYTYNVNASDAVTGYTEKWTEEWTEGSNTYSFSYTYSYDALGEYQGHSYSDGTKTVSYDADGNFVSSSIDSSHLVDEGDGTYSYTDEFGVKTLFSDQGSTITGYITTHSWDGGSETTQYDADWQMISTSITEGSKTTTYDSNWNVTGTSTNFTGLNSATEDGFTVYTETDEWGGETKYYVDSDNNLVKYTESHSGSYDYPDGEGNTVTSSYTNSYTFDANGKPLSESGSHTESNGATYSYSTVHHYNDSGDLTGHTSTNSWSDSYGNGTSTSTFDANWNEKSHTSSGSNTYTYTDENGDQQTGTTTYSQSTNFDSDGNLTGYTNTNTWDGGSETINYDPNWNMVSATITEGSKTTNYDGNWNVTSTSTDFTDLPASTEDGLTVYTETDNWGGVTKYYVDGDNNLVKYTESHSGSYDYTDWQGNTVTSNYENSYTYDANGKILSESGSNTDSNGAVNSYSTVHHYDSDGNLTGHTNTNNWTDTYGNGSSTTEFDANWNQTSHTSSGTNTYSYIDENGVEKTGTTSYSQTTNFDSDGNLTGYTNTNTWDGGSETINYDPNWNMVSASITEGSKTTNYDGNWNVTSTSTDFTDLTSETEDEFTVYTETDEWGGVTKYYVDGDNKLVKYIESHSGSYEYTDWQGNAVTSSYENSYTYDANGKILSESGSNTDSNGAVNSYSTVHHYDGNGDLTGHTSTNSWSDDYGNGTSTTEFDADWKETSHTSSGSNTYTYIDENGAEQTGSTTYSHTTNYDGDGNLTGYTTNSTWDGGSETIQYDANWNMLSATITEGSKTTNYDGNWNITSSSTDFSNLPSSTEDGLTVYTETDNWGGETKYYVDGDQLVKYVESYSGNYEHTDWEGNAVTSTYQNSYTYDANGKLLEESGTSSDTSGGENSYSTVHHYDETTGELTGHTSTNSWSNSNGSGTSTSEFDANWVETSHNSSGSNTYTYIDENGVEKTSTTSYSHTTNFDSDDNLIGYTTTNSWDGGSETTELKPSVLYNPGIPSRFASEQS